MWWLPWRDAQFSYNSYNICKRFGSSLRRAHQTLQRWITVVVASGTQTTMGMGIGVKAGGIGVKASGTQTTIGKVGEMGRARMITTVVVGRKTTVVVGMKVMVLPGPKKRGTAGLRKTKKIGRIVVGRKTTVVVPT